MDTLEAIEKLAQMARTQKIPVFSVADEVLSQLRFGETPVSFVTFDMFAGVFAAAASILLCVGINAWLHVMNPLSQFFAPLQEARLW
jgi:hypothetical protein